MRNFFAIILGRLLRVVVRLVRPGGGSALPGLLVSKLAPNLVKQSIAGLPQGLIVVTGSAGKSTTTKILVALLRAHGLSVFTNPSTANIIQGFFSTVMLQGSLTGKLREQIAVIEADEAHAVHLAEQLNPRGVVILNVVEDQLDRFIEPERVRLALASVAEHAREFVALNASDQNCLLIADSVPPAKTTFFSISESLRGSQTYGLGYAKTYLPTVPEPRALVEVMQLDERQVTIRIDSQLISFEQPNRGPHFAIDAAAAISALHALIPNCQTKIIEKTLNTMPPVFARGEIREIRGQRVEFILVQNPPSTQLNLDHLARTPDCLLVGIGRDVHDPSWLWTVNFSRLDKVDVVTGFNASEIALRLIIEGHELGLITDQLEEAVEAFLALPVPLSGTKTVIFSADTMRRMRRYLGLTNPEDVSRVS